MHRILAIGLLAGCVATAPAQNLIQENYLSTAAAGRITIHPQLAETAGLALTGSSLDGSRTADHSSLELAVVEGAPRRMLGGTVEFADSLVIASSAASITVDRVGIAVTDPAAGVDFIIYDASDHRALFEVTGPAYDFDAATFHLAVSAGWLRVSGSLAGALGAPQAAGQLVGTLALDAEMIFTRAFPLAREFPQTADLPGPTPRAGPDVQLRDVQSMSNYGVVGGVRGYAIGSHTCNVGNQNLQWINDGTPALAMNAYRLHNGRLMQIGLGFAKTACCAAASSGCGLTCNGQGGSVLGAGCLDVYSSGWNGIQSNLQARSRINGFSGAMQAIPAWTYDATIGRRLQVAQTDLASANFPGAQYFIEGHYIATDDAAAGNIANNATYKRVTVDASNNLNLSGAPQTGIPAIRAWRANGLGAGIVDTRVVDGQIDVPGEGRFLTATKVTDLGNGRWLYDYAVFNMNSDLSGGRLEIPVPDGVDVTNIGFHDVNYHSGELYDNTDWTATRTASSVRWNSPQTYQQNPNSNALRWGTMYNFWFEADQPPTTAQAQLGLFKPAVNPAVSFDAPAPQTPDVTGDLDGDGAVTLADLAMLLSDFGCTATCVADIDGDGDTDLNDLSLLLANFGQ